MTSIRQATRYFAVAALVGACSVAPAGAATISITPVSQNVASGGATFVDIILSGLTANETVGGFSMLLNFDDTILSGTSYSQDPDSVMGAIPDDPLNDFSFGFDGGTGSPLDLFYLADFTISEPDLKTAEGTGFRLARVNFLAANDGLAVLTLAVSPSTSVFLSDYSGLNEIPATAGTATICVGDPAGCATPVPEPATLLLLGGGLVALVASRRRLFGQARG